jgi:hypothetical protein
VAGRSLLGGPGSGVKIDRRAAVPAGVTVSQDLRPTAAVPAQAGPGAGPASSVPAARPGALPTPAGSPGADLPSRVRGAVDALRRGLADGTVHAHPRSGKPESWTGIGVEVVRAWTAGLGVEEQRRACRTCAATPAGD